LALDFVSPYLTIILNIFEGNNPNGLIPLLFNVVLDLIVFPLLSIYLAAYLFGKIFPVIKSKYTIAIVYMSFIVVLSCFELFSTFFMYQLVWQGVVKFSVYVVGSLIALVYAVKSHEIFANRVLMGSQIDI
jgi:hypothetical protein